MSTPEYERWTALAVRTPSDVRTEPGGPVPLTWQMNKLQEHSERLSNIALPVDFPYEVERGTAEDALAGLALRTSLLRDLEAQGGSRIHEAALLGATWTEIGAALGLSAHEARQELLAWAAGQHRLYLHDMQDGREPSFGFTHEQHAAVLALTELGDDEGVHSG
ncbi:hypothetical protein ACFU98_42495 [Streptomyces sp. NPDC057575]|uniref:hypothetical protein n=1 Tax=unclassified Streptomyces TaxID=2593676 RepID=UPI00369F6C9C